MDDGAAKLASRCRNVLRPVTGDLEGEAVPHGLAEFHQLPGAGPAVGSHLDLRPLAGHAAARLGLHLRRARALAVAAITPGLHHRLVRLVDPITLLNRDAADRLAAEVIDDADAQRLQIAFELIGDPTLPSNCHGAAGSYAKSSVKTGCGGPLRHRCRRPECREEQQCRDAAPGVESESRSAGSRYIAESHHRVRGRGSAIEASQRGILTLVRIAVYPNKNLVPA